ncbi:hypothetical protein ACFE04_002940 [Oxalis oulophora]
MLHAINLVIPTHTQYCDVECIQMDILVNRHFWISSTRDIYNFSLLHRNSQLSNGLSADENRYNASRGAHLNLKRAEKARILVNKIPAMVDTLVAKTRTWEEDRDMSFSYDGVPLLAMLDDSSSIAHSTHGFPKH